MHPAYFSTLFDPHRYDGEWPNRFAIITAWATTGEHWPIEKCREADERLRARLAAMGVWHRRVTGYAPDGSHAEPGWAAEIGFEEACALGMEFRQIAIYMVEGDDLAVSYCEPERRGRIAVGEFRDRVVPKS